MDPTLNAKVKIMQLSAVVETVTMEIQKILSTAVNQYLHRATPMPIVNLILTVTG